MSPENLYHKMEQKLLGVNGAASLHTHFQNPPKTVMEYSKYTLERGTVKQTDRGTDSDVE